MKNIKRILVSVMLLLSLFVGVFGMSACDINDILKFNDSTADAECEHDYSEWGVLVSAGCLEGEDGYRARYCLICGAVDGEALPAGHYFVNGKCVECGADEEIAGDGDGGSGEDLDQSCQHEDANNDKICDLCNGDTVVVIDIYALNDLHGKIFDTDSQPGVDELTTFIKNAYNTDDNVIVLSSGDMWQGSSESNLTHGNMMTDWLMELGTVAMTFGNHEFDWNNSYIYDNIELANFPFLGINIYDKATNTRMDFAEASVIVERGGAKIGIIGAIGDCLSSISGEKTQDMTFKVGSALTALVKAESERLRSLGCDVIIYSIHDGTASDRVLSDYYDVALSAGYVDVVFEAHSHQSYVTRDSAGVYHLQAGGENKAISHVELKVDIISDAVAINTARTVKSNVYDDCDDDEIVEILRQKYADAIAKGDEYVGRINSYMSGSTLEQICADMYLEYGLKEWGAKYSNIVLGGGFIKTRSPYDLEAGDVYYKDVYSVLPFDNVLCLCTISGSKLRSQFINSSSSDYYLSYTQYGNSIKNNISTSGTYYVVVDSYTAYYAYNGLTVVDMLDDEIFARDMVAEYINRNSTVKEPTQTPSNPGTSPKPSVNLGDYDIKSIAEIKEIIDELPRGTESTEEYYVYVTLGEIQSSKFGNCMVYDDEDGEIFVYGLKDESGTQLYQNLSNKPVAGDKVLLLGKVLYYTADGIYEIKNAKVIAINPEE